VTYFGADSAAGPDSYLKERLSLFLMEKWELFRISTNLQFAFFRSR
jgi:hypothetical protein